ncbi:MAG: beta strand repeat-containing protein, partial [Pseudohongiellaceae bacterium]
TIAPAMPFLSSGQSTSVSFTLDDEFAATFNLLDVSLTPADAGSFSNLQGTGRNFTATLTLSPGLTSETVTINVAAGAVVDGFGNSSPAASSDISIVPGERPNLTSPQDNSYVNIANQSAFLITGTAPPNSAINFTIEAGGTATTFSATTNADALGVWSTPLDLSGLADGGYTIGMRYSETGQIHSDETRLNVTKDTVAPTVTFTGIPATVQENSDINNIIVTISEPITGDLLNTDLRTSLGGFLQNYTTISASTDRFGFAVLEINPGDTGIITIGVDASTVTDLAGNGNPAVTHSTTVTEVPPTYSIAAASATESGSVDFVLTRNKPVVILGRETISYALDYTGQTDPAANADFVTGSLTASSVIIAVGAQHATFSVSTAQDTSFEQSETFILIASVNGSEVARAIGTIANDDQPPVPVITMPTGSDYVNAANNDDFRIVGSSTARIANIVISARGSDATTVDRTVTAVAGDWAGMLDLSPLPGTRITITARAQDTASPLSAATSVVVMRDTVIPVFTITPTDEIIMPGEGTTISFTLDDTTATSFTAADVSVTPVGSGTLSGFTDAGGGNYTATLSTPPGATSAAATIVVAADAVSDAAGNGNARTTANVFLIPVTPIITTPAQNDYVTAANQAAFTIAGRARPNVDIVVRVQTTQISVFAGSDTLGAWSTSLDLSDPLIIGGAYVIGVRASQAGEGFSDETTVTVIKDSIVPTIRYSGVLPVTMVEGNTVTINLVASEATSDLTIEDITLTGSASVENFTSLSSSFYTVDLVAGTFTHPGTVTFTVGATTFTDVAAQDNPTGTPVHTIQVTEIPPTYTVTGVPSTLVVVSLPTDPTDADYIKDAAGAVERGDLVFVVTRSKPTTVPIGEAVGYDLAYPTTANSAVAADFNSADRSGDGVIAMGQTTVTFTVRTADDDDFEQTETVDFAARVARVEVARGQGLIFNNDPPPPPVITGPQDGSYANASNLSIRVYGSTISDQNTTVGVRASDGITTVSGGGLVVNGLWTSDVNMSLLRDGAITIEADVEEEFTVRSMATSITVTKDTVLPTITIAPVNTILSPGQSTNVIFTLDDATARSFDSFDISVVPVGSATRVTFTNFGNGRDYSAIFRVPADATANAATIVLRANAVRDPAGNGNPRVTSSISILPHGPVITTPPDGGFANAVNQNALRFAGTAPVNSAVSLEVRGSIIRSRVNANAIGDWATTLDFSGFPEGVPQTVAARFSEIGGQLSGETRILVTRDVTAPQLFIDGLPGTTLANQTHTITFSTRDLGVTDFDRSDLTVSPPESGSLGPFSTSDEGRTFTATFTAGNTAGRPVIALLEGAFHDAAGNPNAPARLAVRVTTLPPSTAPDSPLIAPATGVVNYANLGNQAALPVSGTCAVNCGTLRVYVTGGGDFAPVAFGSSGPRNFGYNLDVSELTDGELTISVTASQSGRAES